MTLQRPRSTYPRNGRPCACRICPCYARVFDNLDGPNARVCSQCRVGDHIKEPAR